MSDALPLPPHPNLEQYKKLAKDFQHACKSHDPGAIRNWAANWVETIARLQGVQITPEVQRQIGNDAERMEHRWRKFDQTNERAQRCLLADAQFFVAHGHGFASWPKFARYLVEFARLDSPVSSFEAAVDAIVSGDLAALKKLLREIPELVSARSAREHRSTLLHYISANGVEDFRQKTPQNIVRIAQILLEAGAGVNAESDAYGGHSTTLGLTATSWHPEKAGVQIELMKLLLQHGAIIDGPDRGSAVIGCLANGRKGAAEFLASRGARLDLEGASGIGRLDVVKSFFNGDGALKPPTTQKQAEDGFAWACEFGRTSVVDFLLQRRIAVDSKLRHNGQTGLHWAGYGGHVDTVKLLLERKASVDLKDDSFGGTPLGWALYGWAKPPSGASRDSYYEVIALMVGAGAKVDQEWLAENSDRPPIQQLRADARMVAALKGGIDL